MAFDASAQRIYRDFTSRTYWQSLMDAYRFITDQSEITEFRSDVDGVDIVFVQNLPRMYLPAVARAVMRSDMIITRTQHFDPFDAAGNAACGGYGASIPHGPGQFGGRYVLTGTPESSQLRLASVCRVNIPIVGGILEDLILHHIRDLFAAEEAFMADWISTHP